MEARMATARMKLLRNRREAQVRKMRADIAVLLRDGKEDTARIRWCGEEQVALLIGKEIKVVADHEMGGLFRLRGL